MLKRLPSQTMMALLALLAGVVLGLYVFSAQPRMGRELADILEAVGTLWANAMRLIVLPLIVSMLFVAVATHGSSRQVGRIAGLSFGTFIALLGAGVLYVLLTAPPILSRLPQYGESLKGSSPASPINGEPRARNGDNEDSSFRDTVASLIPSNLIKAAASDYLLPLIVFAVLLGLASTRIPSDQRRLLVSVLSAVAEAMRTLAVWVLKLIPLGVFAVAFSTTAMMGWTTIGVIGYWLSIVCLLTVGFTILLYLIAVVAGGVRLAKFARAVGQAQAIALATRSSLAALPALLDGSRRHLHTPEVVVSLTLPLSVSSFKLNRAISSTCRLLFLGHVYGISLSSATIATFVVTALLGSFATPGLPSTGAVETLPFYVAAGIPVEGVILLGSVDSIPDFFMTLLNVTGDLAAMTIVGRLSKIDELEGASEPPESL